MIVYISSFTNTNGVIFPGTYAINATGAGTGDGTEIVKLFVDDIWGARQALLDAAGLSPDGVTEAIDTSQELEAIRKISGAPGNGVIWWATSDPATLGERVLLLNGQVITIASYPELAAAVYCGDGNNPTASAFYKTSDAGGTTRSTSGAYMVMPDLRGYTLRGLDTAASVDPDGASRDIGSVQNYAMKEHIHFSGVAQQNANQSVYNGVTTDMPGSAIDRISASAGSVNYQSETSYAKDDGVIATPNTSSESRMTNVACQFGIRY